MTKLLHVIAVLLVCQSCEDEKLEVLSRATMLEYNTEHEYVDLGLSVYWATCNVGASTPYEGGKCFSWGELVAKKSYNGWTTFKWYAGSGFTKYNSYTGYGNDGFVDNKTVLEPFDDVAYVSWGDDWRMPTKDEFEELINNCVWEWQKIGGVQGYLITSCVPGYTNRSIFLPSDGGCWGINKGALEDGFYWSSEVSDCPTKVWNLNFEENKYSVGDERRYVGHSIRPVKPSVQAENVSLILSRTAMCIEEGYEDSLKAVVKQNYEVLSDAVSFRSSDDAVATVNSFGVIHAISPGTCIITAESGAATAQCRVDVIGSWVTPQMVDLGLSVNWATFNVGADSPEKVGSYFAWGETDSKSTYNWITYSHCLTSFSTYTIKYCDDSDWGVVVDNKYFLDSEDDAATAFWGNDWRVPTPDELDELREKCTWTWTTMNGMEGYKVTSNVSGYTNNFIFLPAAGECGADRQMGVGRFGHYWTSSIKDAGWVAAWKLLFYNGATKRLADNRNYGYPIRPVTKKESSTQSGPEYVDLGLSVNWATFNIGASRPEDYGDYYAWGEAESKATYEWSDYKYCNGSSTSLTKYNNNSSYGVVDDKVSLFLEDDVAYIKWGGNWRMPTQSEYEELLNSNNCSWEWTTSNGIKGYKVTSKKTGYEGSYIFLPAAGSRSDALYNTGTEGRYWSSSLSTVSPDGACRLYFGSDDVGLNNRDRNLGFSVRAVCPSSTYIPPMDTRPKEYVDMGLSVLWATCNVGAETPEECGDYYAWGEIVPDAQYEWATYKWSNGSDISLTKYNYDSYYGIVDNKTELELDDDVAHVIWGEDWCIPSKENLRELIDNCFWTWQSLNGIYGYSVRSKINGNTIFLPAAGSYDWDGFNGKGSSGRYLSRSLRTDYPCESYEIVFWSDWFYYSNDFRYYGYSVRPVKPSSAWKGISTFALNKSSLTMMVNDTNFDLADGVIAEYDGHSFVPAVQWTTSDPSIAVVYESGEVRALNAGTCVITAIYEGHSASCDIIVNEVEPVKEYVDLGLTVMWATCNVGAAKPEEAGYYYAWGETEQKDEYSWRTYKWCAGKEDTFTKYNSQKKTGKVDNKTVLDPEDDVAHVKWGGDWQMPIAEYMNELRNYCTWTWTTQNGVNGYKIQSRFNDNSIFLPATGYQWSRWLYDRDEYASYWGLRNYYNDCYYADNIMFDSESYTKYYGGNRIYGRNVRPVCLPESMDGVTRGDGVSILVNDYVDGVRSEHVAPRIVNDPLDSENRCIMITTNVTPANSYDSQLFIVSDKAMSVGDEVTVTFRYRADKAQTSNTEAHSSPGEMISWNPFGSISFATEWQTAIKTYKVTDSSIRCFTVDLSQLVVGNNCYFDDIRLKVLN